MILKVGEFGILSGSLAFGIFLLVSAWIQIRVLKISVEEKYKDRFLADRLLLTWSYQISQMTVTQQILRFNLAAGFGDFRNPTGASANPG